MKKKKFIQIILGAGRPFIGDQNSSLKKISSDKHVLDWTLHATKFLKPEVHFVAGYQIDQLVARYPMLNYTINPNWSSTGPIVSLLEVQVDDESKYIISYSDILFREKTIKKLIKLDADVSIAIDTKWKERYSSRSLEDMNQCEKVIVSNDKLIDSSTNVTIKNANAESIGLIILKPKVMKFLRNNSNIILKDMKQANLTQLLDFLQIHDFKIKVLDVEGEWAELNKTHDLANFILGTKAQSLSRLEKIIKLSKIAPQISFTISDWSKTSKKIINKIEDKFRLNKLIVRSSAVTEDTFNNSNAGAYLSILGIDVNLKQELRNSIKKVIDSYPDKNQNNEVLVQPMIKNVRVSGVIFTRTLSHSSPYYVVNYDDTSNQTDTITSGSSKDNKTIIILRNNFKNLGSSVPKFLNKLISAIQEIEDLLDFKALDIEFAIDTNEDINILQVRPLTFNEYTIENDQEIFDTVENCVNKFKNLQNSSSFIAGRQAIFGIMPDWNPAEIIGTKPFSLSFDLYRYLVTDKVWATQRAEYGYKDVRPQPLLVSFAGHPYVDVRASFNSFIPLNINKKLTGNLVDFFIKRLIKNPQYHDKVEFEVLPTCYDFNFKNWKSILLSGGFSNYEINNLQSGLKSITNNAIFRTEKDLKNIDILKNRFDETISSNLSELDKALFLIEDCRQYGTLVFAHLARSAFVSVSLLKSAVDTKVISHNAMNSFLNSIETIAHDFIKDAKKAGEDKNFWSTFVNRYGHLRPGTYDITSESYADNVDKYLKPIVAKSKEAHYNTNSKIDYWFKEKEIFFEALLKKKIVKNTNSIELFLKQAIEGREYAKFVFSRNLSASLDLISEYGKKIGLSKNQLANVSLSSLFAIKSGKINLEDAYKFLKRESDHEIKNHNKTNKIEFPPLITKESDFKIFKYPRSQPNYVGTGKISAEIFILSAKNVNNVKSLSNKILLIPQADPGFDWIFGQNIAGFITMYGGGNSHMAIRAKEFDIPAALGVGESLYNLLSSSSIIELDVTNRKIEIIK